MLRYSKLSKEELRELKAKSMSEEDVKRMRKLDEETSWILSMHQISEVHGEERASGKAKLKRKR